MKANSTNAKAKGRRLSARAVGIPERDTNSMTLVTLTIVLVIVGVVLALINPYGDANFMRIIYVVVILAVLLLLQMFGVIGGGSGVKVSDFLHTAKYRLKALIGSHSLSLVGYCHSKHPTRNTRR